MVSDTPGNNPMFFIRWLSTAIIWSIFCCGSLVSINTPRNIIASSFGTENMDSLGWWCLSPYSLMNQRNDDAWICASDSLFIVFCVSVHTLALWVYTDKLLIYSYFSLSVQPLYTFLNIFKSV